MQLNQLPPIQASGAYLAPPEVTAFLGYDPSRRWQRGQRLDQVLQVGDFPHLNLGQRTLRDFQAASGNSASPLRLSQLGLLRWQTLGDLVRALPHLRDYPIAAVPPVAAVLRAYGISVAPSQSIAEVVQNPTLAALPLAAVDLQRYSLQSLPGLETVPLNQFRRWQQSPVAQVPGLSQALPLAQRNPTIARVDIAFGPAEHDRWRTVSGSHQEGFQVPCPWRCPHVELGNCLWNCLPFQNNPLAGQQWISGKYQQVRGGIGPLAVVNGGKEPTGRHPFGSEFKVVIWETDEASGTAERALFFRICLDGLGCTPYFIGPVPWFPVQEAGTIEL